MTKFKRSTAAAALLMATAIPAFAQTAVQTTMEPLVIPEGVVTPENHILLQFTDMEGFYVVQYETAAEICEISEEEFALIADDPTTGVIYCEELADPAVRQAFLDDGSIMPLTDFEDSDDDDDDGDFGDDAQETADDEAADEDNDGVLDDITEDDDVEAPANDNEGGDDSDSVEEEDVTD